MAEVNHVTIEQVQVLLKDLGYDYHWVGDPRKVDRVGSLLCAQPRTLYYFTGTEMKSPIEFHDSVILCRKEAAQTHPDVSFLVVEADPQIVFYKLCSALFSTSAVSSVHHTAIIHPESSLAPDVVVGPYAVIGKSVIGASTMVGSHAVIHDDCVIGSRVRIEPHCAIGVSGAVWVWDEAGNQVTLPQVGRVRVGDDVFIGAHVGIVRGLFNEATEVGHRCRIAPGSMLGHSVVLEDDCHLANNVSIAGSARIGAGSFLGSGCSIRSHAKLAPRTVVGNGAAVVADVVEPDTVVAGVPARPLGASTKLRKGVPRPKSDD
jgi:UDP-3-O-[3-hydroxymyristoyl] glucosamine N-acyltransferase LpxD